MNFNKAIFFFKDLIEESERRITLFFQSISSLFKVLILSKFGIQFPKVNDQECYILANGPSLKKVLEEKEELLKKSTLICVNAFPTTPEFKKFKPGYGVILDPLFFLKKYEELLPHVRITIEKLVQDTEWKFTLFIPCMARSADYIREIPEKNPNISICYFNYTIVNGYSFLRHFLYRKNIGMPRCQNVVGASLFIALNLNFKKIYLLGADHNLGKNIFVNDNNEVCMIHEHFYSDGKQMITPVYKKPGGGERMKISGFYSLCVKTFETYYFLEEYAVFKGSKIYNVTEGSFIDAFERKTI